MKKYSFIAMASAVLLSGCAKELIENAPARNSTIQGEISFVADTDNSSDTKTALDGVNINWVADDQVMIFGTDASSAAKVIGYKVASAGASTTLNYFSNIVGAGAFTDSETPQYALYPCDATGASISGSTITFQLPETQYYAANSFGNGSNVAVGTVANTAGIATIKFKNVCGYLRLKLSVPSGDAATVGKIVLTTKGTEKIWGTFAADASSDTPTASKTAVDDGGTSITLDCGAGVALSTTPVTFHFVVPDGALTAGFTAEVYSVQDHLIKTLTSTSAKTISRNRVKAIENQTLPWLPSNYTECEYISIGDVAGPVINTGVVPYYGMDISMKFGWHPSLVYTGEGKGSNAMLFGVEEYPNTLIDFSVVRKQYNSGATIYGNFSGRFMGVTGGSTVVTSGVGPNYLHHETTPVHSFTLQFRETTSYLFCPTATPEYNMTITNNTDRPTMPGHALGFLGRYFTPNYTGGCKNIDAYEFSIVNNSGSGAATDKERRFIPVLTSTSEYGMFDLVTNSFFGNVGTGSFTGAI